VSIASTNGWYTNFDNFVIADGTGSSATPSSTPTRTATPTPTRTPSPTPTSTPGVGATTVRFDDLSNPNRVLSGQYPSGVIDWGTANAWYLSGPYGLFTSQSISFNGPTIRSATFTFVGARRLLQIDAYNGGTTSSTISLSCAGQSMIQSTLAPGQLVRMNTNWTAACATITVGSSNGWDTNFDNIVMD
jgi:hypothetical protein